MLGVKVPLLLVVALMLSSSVDSGQHNKVKLTDVTTLTLLKGQMTSGRRSAPVPQLNCIYGGSVDCSDVFLPSAQCYNRGSNGIDVQWECKADLDASWRFGHVQVTCEGYDYPDDPYVLAGSCGLEYYIDYVDSKQKSQSSYYKPNYYSKDSNGSSKNWVALIGVGIVVYAIYKTCIARGPVGTPDGRSRWNDDFNDQDRRRPPPPGFRRDFFDSSYSSGPSTSSSCGAGTGTPSGSTGAGGGGFWTGAATGGLLGYMFGARNTGGSGTTTGGSTGGWFGGGQQQPMRGNRNSGWGEPQPSTSSGFTREATGFASTRRR